MKSNELSKLAGNGQEIEKRLKETRSQLSREQSKRATGGAPTKPSTIKNLRRTVAQLLTVQNAKTSGKKGKGKKASAPKTQASVKKK